MIHVAASLPHTVVARLDVLVIVGQPRHGAVLVLLYSCKTGLQACAFVAFGFCHYRESLGSVRMVTPL